MSLTKNSIKVETFFRTLCIYNFLFDVDTAWRSK